MAGHREEFSTIIGADAVFKGQIQFQNGLRLLGRVDGEIGSGGELVIGEGAILNGDASAEVIRLDGQVKGNIKGRKKVQLSSSAKLEGDLETARLEVAEGAVLVGRCSIGVNGQGNGAAKTKPASTVGTPSTGADSKAESKMPQVAKR